MNDDSVGLMDQLRAALNEEVVLLELGNTFSLNLADGQADWRPTVRLFKPGKTARSKPIATAPLLVGDLDTQPMSAMLHVLADLLAEERR